MSFFSRKSSIVAVLIEDASVRLALSSATEGKPATVTEHTTVDFAPGVVLRQRIQEGDQFAKLVSAERTLLKRAPSTVVLGLPARLVFSVARTGLKESPVGARTVASLVGESIPIPAEQLQMKDQWTAPNGTMAGAWSCLAIERAIVEEYRAVLKESGFSNIKIVPLSLAFLAVYASSATVQEPAIVLNLTTNPGSITLGSKTIILDERLLFESAKEESLTETLDAWIPLLPKEKPTPVIAVGDEEQVNKLLTATLAKRPSLSLSIVKGDMWTYAAALASAELVKPPLPSF